MCFKDFARASSLLFAHRTAASRSFEDSTPSLRAQRPQKRRLVSLSLFVSFWDFDFSRLSSLNALIRAQLSSVTTLKAPLLEWPHSLRASHVAALSPTSPQHRRHRAPGTRRHPLSSEALRGGMPLGSQRRGSTRGGPARTLGEGGTHLSRPSVAYAFRPHRVSTTRNGSSVQGAGTAFCQAKAPSS